MKICVGMEDAMSPKIAMQEKSGCTTYICRSDLLKRPPLRSLGHIPLPQILIRKPSFTAHLDRPATTPPQSANDQDGRVASPELRRGVSNTAPDLLIQLALVGIRFPPLQRHPTHLARPRLQRQRRAGIARVVAERGDPPLLALEEFHVVQHAAAPGVPAQHILPAGLLLVAVRESDVDVFQRERVLVLELLEADDDVVGGGVRPGALVNERGAGGLEIGVVEDADGTPLDVHGEAVFDELSGGRGGYCARSMDRVHGRDTSW